MTAVLSPSSSSPTPAQPVQPPPSANPSHPALPPLVTSTPVRRSNLQRPLSNARNRLSTQSNISGPLQTCSRPLSYAFPIFHSSLPYALVRDFAYQLTHPLHYGPPPAPSGAASDASTPVSESQHGLQDVNTNPWDESKNPWSGGSWDTEGYYGKEQLPSVTYHDGPPWSEDEDLHSPVVVSSSKKRHKSSSAHYSGGGFGWGREKDAVSDLDTSNPGLVVPTNYEKNRGAYGRNRDGRDEAYYIDEEDENARRRRDSSRMHPSEYARRSRLGPPSHNVPGQRDSHFAATLPNRSYAQPEYPYESEDDEASEQFGSPHREQNDGSRYSRDYQFTIASLDEEMHGKAVALFDFERENENELPLVEGQVIWVSYRHGQGWLVAEDPKTGESGLVPEEYVRLLRDIEGEWGSLNGAEIEGRVLSPTFTEKDMGTPTQAEHMAMGHSASSSNGSNTTQRPSMVSTFSTSSKDLHPYPQHLLGTQAGQAPPQVVHYHGQRGGSQANTPTTASPGDAHDNLTKLSDSEPRRYETINFSQGPENDSEKTKAEAKESEAGETR
ncbi:MAG: HOG (high osmolarity glycerol) pathway protein [Pycnora praestabilis]|nr:MAG: HOG (high osmolarity glycerol) pathway protein [Pycnora praestabilis]